MDSGIWSVITMLSTAISNIVGRSKMSRLSRTEPVQSFIIRECLDICKINLALFNPLTAEKMEAVRYPTETHLYKITGSCNSLGGLNGNLNGHRQQ